MDYLLPLAFMGLFAYVTGGIASRKGYNPIVWGLIGALLSIIGLLIAAILPNRKAAYS